MGLLHNGEVSAEIRIKYFVKAKHLKRGYHLSLHACANRIPEFFAESGAYRRGCLHNHVFGGICDGCKHLVCEILFLESSGRTYGDTLAAGYAACLAQSHVECGTDIRNKTSVIGADYAYTLNTFANCHTAAAQNTFAVVAEHMGSAVVNYRRRFFSVI